MMTVREMIEHLAQQDQELVVKLRDPHSDLPIVLHDIDAHGISPDYVIDRNANTVTPVVVIG